MNIKMLPNKFKKLGLFLFFIGFIVSSTSTSARKSFLEGYNSSKGETYISPSIEPIFIEKQFGENTIHFFDVLILLGLMMYMISKEKIEDDYINALRLESFQLTAILTLTSSIILYAFSKNLKLELDIFITLFLWVYLITFAIKKRLY